ncbi:unnamed protein product [Acanthosepion pharaonis]|uniref:Uncharacterized protein n=1 Tax=Acanthosepion pharaonis TaxID=158019 RepID=A0A812C2D1_ACAPH|nr:unnamed protein product [Sepia pharaonis]
MALSKKSIPDSEIEAILCESSDDKVDNLEFEELYDNDIDGEYVQEPNDSSDNSDLDDVPPRKKKKVVRVSPALPVVGPSTAPATAPVAGLAAPPAVAPAAPLGRRRRCTVPQTDRDELVRFNTTRIRSRNGFMWSTRPNAGSLRTLHGPSQQASQADIPEKCFSLLSVDEIMQ